MYLKKIEIQGFKSFARKSTLEFNPGITCVVGPNGSGKSNVADAVRWVMGEQSMKALRSKKSEDIIFAGSDKKTQLGSAEVSLYIDNQDGAMPIDYSEVVITRRVYRNGEGVYFINKNSVRLQDIQMLLARSNFGQRTYSVIAQGMIDSFIMASPKERKELFDEAAGVRQYQMKRDQSVLKLERTKENLGQVEVLLQEIAPRLRSLTRQVKRWERREEVEKKLREKQTHYYSYIYQDIYQKHQDSFQEFKKFEEKRNMIQKEIDNLQKNLEDMEKESSRGEIFSQLQKKHQEFLDIKNSLLQEKVVLEGRMQADQVANGQSDLTYINNKKKSLEHKLQEINKSTENLKNEINNKEKELSDKTEKQKDILDEYEKIENQLEITRQKLETKEPLEFEEIKKEVGQLYTLQDEFIEKISQVKEVNEIKLIKKEANKIKDRLAVFLDKVKSSASTSPKEIFSLQKNLKEIIEKRDYSVNTINEVKTDLSLKTERLEYFLENKNNIEQELEQIKRQIERASTGSKQEVESKLKKQKEELENKIEKTEKELEETQNRIESFNEEEQVKKESLFSIQKQFRQTQDKLNLINNKINNIKVKLAKLETKKEDLEHEVKEEMPEKFWSEIFKEKEERPEPLNKEEVSNEILKLKHKIDLIGGIDENTRKEYEETKERHDFLSEQSEDLNKSIRDLEKVIENLDKTIETKFNKSFKKIDKQFSKYFKMLFNGGQARLKLVREEEKTEKNDEENEEEKEEAEENKTTKKFIAGVEIKATPPGKKLKNINMLSGGERALSSIALVCAILANNPSPFVVLDEVDAALDEANSLKFSSILEELSQKSQFIVITHNRTTMEKAQILYGVTMGEDSISKVISVKMDEAEEVIKQHGNRQ
ncbi:MAG: chromosome segregation SMC family protein [Patescibacteria group bacterium]|nr:chromosome segregation SMC family protein [Patescibacteria group bacterium]